MAHRFVLLKRRADLGREAMHSYWAGHHADLALSLPGFHRYALRYVQNHLLPSAIPSAAEEYDGIGEISSTSDRERLAAFHQIYHDFLRLDEANFLDIDQCVSLYAARRVVMITPRRPSVKFFSFIRRQPTMSHTDFLHHWEHCHGPLVRDFPDFRGKIVGYIQHQLDPDREKSLGTGKPVFSFDGIAELHFESKDAFQAFFSLGEKMQPIRDDEKNFLLQPSMRMLVREIDFKSRLRETP
ncbi:MULTISPECIES: EthD domain-containing protein [unclassified Chelatococcus]|uniref:EthD domain-containing protein n=1 Tax=unclassified Chelatococcus TaxID=2638111 RepID=UPI001BCADFAB|nr:MULTISPECIES: EthD domain-containing protein [unclassified Chelatococcus]MBS7743461.1 EthD domain-containing protein [Chelatococcus sp. HY11]MBX3547099.1 EthD domain-containing protein [Chelatococcus sp.]CAH1663670.1 putative EthD family reductase [Hyphomicrobiales bacterium]CAH1687823.1 putative EthD family reductase [Hyphomicrobiales bacterium]